MSLPPHSKPVALKNLLLAACAYGTEPTETNLRGLARDAANFYESWGALGPQTAQSIGERVDTDRM